MAIRDSDIPRGMATLDGSPVIVHFDGAFETIRGQRIATFGYTIEGGGLLMEEGGLAVRPNSENATNNVAEYVGAIRALERLRGLGHAGSVEVRGDSELVIRQMRGEYKVRAEHLKDYHDRLAQVASTFPSVSWVWVPREQNARADALTKEALQDAFR